MKNGLLVLIAAVLFLSCGNQKQVELYFLDEYVLSDSIRFKNTLIGGLSGLDYANNQYYFVVDDARNPRVLSGDITISNYEIKSIGFKNIIFFK